MNIFDIYIAYMSFDIDGGGKERPVLVVELEDGLAAVYNVTSQFGGKSEYIRSKYYPLKDWKQEGLLKQSYVDTVKLRYVSASIFTTPIGTLTDADKVGLIAFLTE